MLNHLAGKNVPQVVCNSSLVLESAVTSTDANFSGEFFESRMGNNGELIS